VRPRRASSAPAATRAGVSRSRASLVRHSDRRCSAPHDASAPGDGCCGGPAWSRRCGGVDIPGLASDQQLPELGRLREHVAAEDHQGDQRHFDKTPALLEACVQRSPTQRSLSSAGSAGDPVSLHAFPVHRHPAAQPWFLHSTGAGRGKLDQCERDARGARPGPRNRGRPGGNRRSRPASTASSAAD